MEYFLQQLINSLTLGSIYGLIAIGYTMVYGIIGMINFAHGDVFMIGSFVSLIAMVILGVGTGAFLPLALLVVLFAAILITSVYGWTLERVAYRPLRGSFRLAALITALGASIFLQNFVQVSQGAKIKPIQPVIQGGFTFFENGSLVSLIAMVILGVGTGAFLPLALLLVLFAAILITSVYGWTLERVAYRPLRGSFRLAALITALGASIFLQNFVQVSQGAKIKPIQPVIKGGFTFFENGSLVVSLSYLQIFIIIITIILLSIFSYIISKTPLGRSQRACEQDLTMSKLLGINVDRTISITFIIGASLASVAGMMFVLYYGVIDFFIGFLTGIKAFTAAVLGGIGSIPGAVIGGLLIGLIETFWSAYFTIEYKDVAVFSILVIVLIFRPYGILGKPEVEKV